MGANSSLPLAEEDSIVDPGNPSIVSAPIEVDYERFVDEILAILKHPMRPDLEALTKEVKCEPGSIPDEFEVALHLDPEALTKIGLQNPQDPSLERIEVYQKIKLDRAARVLKTVAHKPRWQGEEPEVTLMTETNFTKDPFRIDYFWKLADGTRVANGAVLGTLQLVVNQAMFMLLETKVKMKYDPVKMVMTCDPVDETIAAYDTFFDAFIVIMKEGMQGKHVAEEIAEGKAKVTGMPNDDYGNLSWDKTSGTVSFEQCSKDGKQLFVSYYSFVQQPLSMQIHVHVDDKRVDIKHSSQIIIQSIVNATVNKASSGTWLGGMFG